MKSIIKELIENFKKLNLGIQRLLIIGTIIGASIIGIIIELIDNDFEYFYFSDNWFIASIFGGIPIYWIIVFAGLWIHQGFEESKKKTKIRYKALKETPCIKEKIKKFTKYTKIVDRNEFYTINDTIPLVVTNQYRIYPDEVRDLKLLANRRVGIVYLSYLSAIEKDIKEYFLDEQTINDILNSYKQK